MKYNKIKVDTFLNTKYREYCDYVLYRRAIPNMIDGLKTSQRKILYVSNKVCKTSLIKCASLSGDVISKGNYHHGNASLEDAINVLVQPYNNNIPWLLGKGSFGSRMVPIAAAARYTYTKVSPDFYKYYTDFDITVDSPDPEDPEPQFYLPVIPTILLNGVRGIAVGFATRILARDPKRIKELCLAHMNGKDISTMEIAPYFESFNGEIKFDVDKEKYIAYGDYSKGKRNTILITEVPPKYSRESFVENLNKLEENGIIKDYKDRCSKKGFNFEVKLATNPDTFTKEELLIKLNMAEPLSETLTVIDQNLKVKVYENVQDIIKDFCDYRLLQYKKRYEHWVERDTATKRIVDIKIGFIKAVIADKIKVIGTSKKDLKNFLITKTKLDIESIDSLISLPIHTMCADGLNDLNEKSKKLGNDINTWKNIDLESQYKKEIKGV